MNPDVAAEQSAGGSQTAPNLRKERGAIAAQACETCRNRKQKCDEQRPKCGTCQKFSIECRYREPQPTKKDKTLVEILDRLKSLENKVDSLGPTIAIPSSMPGFPSTIISPQSSIHADSTERGSLSAPSVHSTSPAPSHPSGQYVYASPAYKVLAWPVVQQLLDNVRPTVPGVLASELEDQGTSIALGTENPLPPLPVDGLESLGLSDRNPLNLQLQVPASTSSLPLSPSALNWETMQQLNRAYFDTFNLLYPILDRQTFHSSVLARVMSDGFDEGISSTLVCLVFALGEVAVSVSGEPLSTYKGRVSGVRGGTRGRPPGLAFFNEARKRMGFALTECSIENVQMFALAGLYYETCCHHFEFWRMTASASLACQALITSKPQELTSPSADLIKRVYWHCSIMETYLHLELELPLTGLEKLEDVVGLPDFSGPFCGDDYMGNQASHYQEHFASQIILRRLSSNFHHSMNGAIGSRSKPPTGGFPTPAHPAIALSAILPSMPTPPEQPPDSTALVKQLVGQLDQWRLLLPAYLGWDDRGLSEFANSADHMYTQDIYPVQHIPTVFTFTTDLDAPPVSYPYAADVQVALLRTRYYYIKYLLHRPFVYKAIHHGDMMTRDDAEGAAECLKACLRWPVTMSPTCRNKRLVPYLFGWSHNVLSILVLLHLSKKIPVLSRIRSMGGDRFEAEATETVNLCVDWLRDLKDCDAAARWCWSVACGLFGLDDE